MNTLGSYRCDCIRGYAGDGFTCIGSILFFFILGNTDAAVVREVASHQCDPGLIPAQCHTSELRLLFAAALLQGCSLGSPVSVPALNLTSSNSNSTRLEDPHENLLKPRLMWLPTKFKPFFDGSNSSYNPKSTPFCKNGHGKWLASCYRKLQA